DRPRSAAHARSYRLASEVSPTGSLPFSNLHPTGPQRPPSILTPGGSVRRPPLSALEQPAEGSLLAGRRSPSTGGRPSIPRIPLADADLGTFGRRRILDP